MNRQISKIVAEKEKKLSFQPARNALTIIWSTGVACAAVIILFIFIPLNVVSRGADQINITRNSTEGIRSIDQLLLTTEEAQLSDNKSFVNGALRFQWRNQEPDLNQDKNRVILYNNILTKKLQKLPRKTSPDFSIRPVPK
ncbi:MAG: hypothetical protein JNM19_04040 [Chitinophagaceae bacterium]|nr:hypothetical protein [Chitinophagaceae bacterium]